LKNTRQVIESKNGEIEILRRKIEETDREARAGRAALNWLKKDLERENEREKILRTDLEKRNLEISRMRKQLSDNQTILIGKNKMIDQLQIEFEQMKSELLEENEELRQLTIGQRESAIKNEIQRLVDENLQEKVRDFNEISKGLNISDDNIKTEKFDDEG